MIGGKIGVPLILAVAMTGCGVNTSTHKDQLNAATELCRENEGIFSIHTELWPGIGVAEETEVYCNNGSRFVFTVDKMRPFVPPVYKLNVSEDSQ